jgi:serine/threonine protein kinase
MSDDTDGDMCHATTRIELGVSCGYFRFAAAATSFAFLQIVTGTSPSTRGKLPTPDTPRDCPAVIWDLIQQCLVLKPEDRPTAKQVTRRCSAAVRRFSFNDPSAYGASVCQLGSLGVQDDDQKPARQLWLLDVLSQSSNDLQASGSLFE